MSISQNKYVYYILSGSYLSMCDYYPDYGAM